MLDRAPEEDFREVIHEGVDDERASLHASTRQTRQIQERHE